MDRLQLKKLTETYQSQFAGKQLADKSLGPELIATELAKNLPFKLEEVEFTVKGAAEIRLYNSKDDTGDDKAHGIIGRVVPHAGERAWLKYRVGLGAKAEGGVDSHGFGFTFGVEGNAELLQYRAHDPASELWATLTDDLTSPRFILRVADLDKLQEGDVVAMRVGGQLTAGLKASWAHIYAQSISALTSLLAAGETIALDIDMGASAGFQVTFEDGFEISFARLGETLRLDIKRSDTTGVEAGTSLGVKAQFADPEAVEKILNGLVDSVIGTPVDQLLEQLEGKTMGQLSDTVRAVIQAVLRRLGVPAGGDPLAALREKIEAVRKRTKSIVEKVASAKLAAAFDYEYSRINSKESIVQARLTPAAARQLHAQLIRGRLQPLLQAAEEDLQKEKDEDKLGVSLESYVRQNKLLIEHGYGFGLSLGPLTLSGQDTIEKDSQTTIKRIAGGRDLVKAELTYARGYKKKWFRSELAHSVLLQGTMPDFADKVTADEFEYGIAVVLRRVDKNEVGNDELRRFVDLAALWGIVPIAGIEREHQRVRQAIGNVENVTFSCELKLYDRAFEYVLDDLRRGDLHRVARALAAGMPWQTGYSGIHDTPESREQNYAGLWLLYLTDRVLTPQQFAEAAAHHFRLRNSDLAAYEEDGARSGNLNTVGGLTEKQRVRPMVEELQEGAADLRAAIERGASSRHVRKAFKKLWKGGEQSHWARSFGAYLNDLVESRPALLTQPDADRPTVDRVARVAFEIDGKKKTLTLSSSTTPAE